MHLIQSVCDLCPGVNHQIREVEHSSDADYRWCKGMQSKTWKCSIPDGIGGGGGGRSELVLVWTALGGLGGPLSFIPYNLDSLDRVRGREDPREALGDSVFSVLEL